MGRTDRHRTEGIRNFRCRELGQEGVPKGIHRVSGYSQVEDTQNNPPLSANVVTGASGAHEIAWFGSAGPHSRRQTRIEYFVRLYKVYHH